MKLEKSMDSREKEPLLQTNVPVLESETLSLHEFTIDLVQQAYRVHNSLPKPGKIWEVQQKQEGWVFFQRA